MRKRTGNRPKSKAIYLATKPDVEGVTQGDLLEELVAAEESIEDLRADDVTAKRFAARIGISHNAARRRLDGMVTRGRLVKVPVRVVSDAGTVTVGIAYRRPTLPHQPNPQAA